MLHHREHSLKQAQVHAQDTFLNERINPSCFGRESISASRLKIKNIGDLGGLVAG